MPVRKWLEATILAGLMIGTVTSAQAQGEACWPVHDGTDSEYAESNCYKKPYEERKPPCNFCHDDGRPAVTVRSTGVDWSRILANTREFWAAHTAASRLTKRPQAYRSMRDPAKLPAPVKKLIDTYPGGRRR